MTKEITIKSIEMPEVAYNWFKKVREEKTGETFMDFVDWNDENLMNKGLAFLSGDELEIKSWINKNEDLFALAWIYPELVEAKK